VHSSRSMLKDCVAIFAILVHLVYGTAYGTRLQAGPSERAKAQGCVWSVTGHWHEGRGQPLVAGELIPPGAFVSADGSAHHPSSQDLLILMPDGQRLYLDCQDQTSCSRGFRLPALTEPVDDEMIATFGQVAAERRREVAASSSTAEPDRLRQPPNLLRFEAVVTPDQDGSVNVSEAIEDLPPGSYRFVIDSASGFQEKTVRWGGSGEKLYLALRDNSLYHLHAYGTLNVERMRGSLLVLPPREFEDFNLRLARLRAALHSWNERSPGWPADDFLALYLEALKTASGAH
jgi:hypothetical protein